MILSWECWLIVAIHCCTCSHMPATVHHQHCTNCCCALSHLHGCTDQLHQNMGTCTSCMSDLNILSSIDPFLMFLFHYKKCAILITMHCLIFWMGLDSKLDLWWWHLDAILELYLSGLLPLLICCTIACDILSSIYRFSHIQNTLQGFCVGLSFMQQYIFPFPHASTLEHCLHHLLY